MKKILSIAMVLAASVASNSWSAVVGHTGKYFTVTDHEKSYKVGRESLDGTLKNVNKTNLAMFMKRGRISAHKTSDGSYVLRGHVNGLGGGPIAGVWAYWLTKSTMYGTAIAAGTAAVATGVGAAVVAAGGGATLAASAGAGAVYLAETTAGIGTVVAASAGTASGGAGFVAAVVGGGALSGTATGSTILAGSYVATAGVATATAGTTLGTVGFVEGCSIAAAAFFGSIPFLP